MEFCFRNKFLTPLCSDFNFRIAVNLFLVLEIPCFRSWSSFCDGLLVLTGRYQMIRHSDGSCTGHIATCRLIDLVDGSQNIYRHRFSGPGSLRLLHLVIIWWGKLIILSTIRYECQKVCYQSCWPSEEFSSCLFRVFPARQLHFRTLIVSS